VNSYWISHYSILEKLGAGGMGEVYKAHDTTLDRPVALKILPPNLVADQDRLRRFVQEAKSASALNHPHIITIYEIGEAKPQTTDRTTSGPEGRASGGEPGAFLSLASETPIHYIAMEYIEGETLHHKIHRSKATLRKLLEYLVQAADGLAKAHAAGIIHRDLKPDNIMINKDGYSKVLDFGLAKLIEPIREQAQPAQGDLEEAATALMRNHSQSGMVMGTVGYMSPEQAQGKTVDQRSDIFAFGCILYEVVTGHKPFEGDSLIDSLHKIIYAPPPPVKDFNPNCPYELQRIIRRCLAKDPEDRYQRVKDISLDLREFLEEYKTEASASSIYPGISVGPLAAGERSLLDAATVEPHLDESDPRVLQLTRFSKSSVALSILGLVSAIVLWPLYQRANIGTELKLDYTKEAALSKAREVVSSFGYNTANLETYTHFRRTNVDLKHLATKEGPGEARRAVREGKIAAWQVIFAPSSDEASSASFSSNVKPGQFLVSINPQGQLVSFYTPPREGAERTEVDQQQAVAIAAEQARRWLTFDPSGYDTEVLPRSNPPGVVEITWRNPNPIFAHQEVVQANLQGSKITKLNRSLEPPQSIKETNSLSDVVTKARTVILVLAFVAMYAFGVVFLISGKRWYALGRNLPIAATVLLGVGFFGLLYFQDSPNQPIEAILVGVVFTVIVGVAFFPSAAGLFEWLRVFSPVRLFGAEQFAKRHCFSASAASSLVHGVLGGALLAGISSAIGFLMARVPGSEPTMGQEMSIVNSGWPLAQALLVSTTVALVFAFGITILVELTERLIRGGILASVVPALLIAVVTTSYSQPGLRLIALSFLSAFLTCLVAVQLYRSRGLAAVWLGVNTYMVLDWAASSRYLQDPGIVLQSNLLVLVVVLLLMAGVWGYVRTRLKTNLSVFAAK
jgi:serine/threonine protein kinase